jgi:hypothetical protein
MRDLSGTSPVVVEGKVRSGKKITVVDLSQQPTISNNNPRAALARVPGLFVSDPFEF